MISHLNATLTIDARDKIGEGPAWDAAAGRLLWSDNAAGIIHESRPDGAGGWRETRTWNLGRPIGAAMPRAKGGLVVAGGTEIFMLSEAGDIEPFVHLDADPNRVRLNDAKCDSHGRLWAGTLSSDFTPGRGALYRIDPSGAVTTMQTNMTISNGLDWSPDGLTFYLIDSPTHSVDAFDFDAVRGTISNRRTIVTIPRGEGLPDGMTVDRDGYLWVAVIGAGEVRRYTPGGTQLARVEVSASAVTSCAFGGLDGTDLFITSASVQLPDVAFTDYGFSIEMVKKSPTTPGAGGLFVCRPGAMGRPATPFAG